MTIEGLFEQLKDIGFLKHADEGGKKEAMRVLAEHEIVFSDYCGRVFDADSEDLAEGEVKVFIEDRIGSFLTRQGIDVENLELDQDISEIGYTLVLGGEKVVLYTEDELEEEDFWGLCAERAFRAVNRLLISADSEERVFSLYGGNDTQAVFLTREMFELIRDSDALPNSEKPRDVGGFG